MWLLGHSYSLITKLWFIAIAGLCVKVTSCPHTCIIQWWNYNADNLVSISLFTTGCWQLLGILWQTQNPQLSLEEEKVITIKIRQPTFFNSPRALSLLKLNSSENIFLYRQDLFSFCLFIFFKLKNPCRLWPGQNTRTTNDNLTYPKWQPGEQI